MRIKYGNFKITSLVNWLKIGVLYYYSQNALPSFLSKWTLSLLYYLVQSKVNQNYIILKVPSRTYHSKNDLHIYCLLYIIESAKWENWKLSVLMITYYDNRRD